MYTLIKRISEINTNLIELGIIAKRNAEVEGGEVNKEIQYHIIKATNHITKALSKAIDPNKVKSEREDTGAKRCPRCHELKPKTEYHTNTTKKGGISTYCKTCENKYKDEYIKKQREKSRREEQQGFKECSKCNKIKLKTEFYKNRSRNDGLNDWCKECSKEYLKEYKQRQKSKRGKEGEPWSKEEETYLWENKHKNIKQLSKELGRSRIAIQTRLRILKRVADTKANTI